MNYNSYICKFIYEHNEDWENLLTKDYGIKIKKEDSYAIFNYGYDCDFSNPIVQEARGIIIDHKSLEVVCWPFRKFGNHNEVYADNIDWNNAKVLEKIDGSIIKLWYDFKINKWQFSTNGIIRAENAPINDHIGLFFGSIIKLADNYNDIKFDILNKEYTYIFELVSPTTQVVIEYNSTSLFHIGTRNNITGKEFDMDIGIQKPKAFDISSLDQCIKIANELNKKNDNILNEGFVIVDKNWNRIKVKSPDYIIMNHLMQLKNISKKDCLDMIINNSKNIDIICLANPNLIHILKYYDFKLAELKYNANQIGILSTSLYKEYNGDRSVVAKIISKHKLSFVGFRCLSTNENGSDILMKYPIEKIAKLIPDYEQEDLYSLFLLDLEKNNH